MNFTTTGSAGEVGVGLLRALRGRSTFTSQLGVVPQHRLVAIKLAVERQVSGNPKRPDMAVLERNTNEDRSQFKLSAILSAIILLIGIAGLLGMCLISRS